LPEAKANEVSLAHNSLPFGDKLKGVQARTDITFSAVCKHPEGRSLSFETFDGTHRLKAVSQTFCGGSAEMKYTYYVTKRT
jgi:hypothetical protein